MVKEIPLTQGKVALVDDEDYDRINQYKWCVTTGGYAQTNTTGTHLHLHRVIFNAKPGEQIDHINGDGFDNRRCNLRIATKSQNMMNQSKQLGHSSKYKGVCWNKQENKWISYICPNGRNIHLGYFKNEEDAAHAYDVAAKKHFKEYARLNFPRGE